MRSGWPSFLLPLIGVASRPLPAQQRASDVASSAAFDLTSELLTSGTQLEPLVVRGTVRLAVKAAGLDAARVSGTPMRARLRSLLPNELERRGVPEASALCARVERSLASAEVRSAADGADRAAAIFERLGEFGGACFR